MKKTPSTKLSKIVLRKETISVLRAAELAIAAGGALPVCPRPLNLTYIRENCF